MATAERARLLGELEPAERRALLARMSDRQRRALRTHWRLWAHRGQLPPESGNWLFFAPRDGMRVLDKSSGQEIRYHAGWKSAVRPAAPAGGATVDAEARAAIAALLEALTAAGVFAPA